MRSNRSKAIKALITVVIVSFVISAVSVCLLLAYSGTGEATENIEKDRVKEVTLSKAQELAPETNALDESVEYSSDYETSYFLIDAKGNNIGMISVDCSTGKICLFFDASESSGKRQSSEVGVAREEATEKVKRFLGGQGVSLENYTLEGDPLVCVGMEGPPDNPIPVYSYEFNYRMQVNGLFVDDYEDGNGALTISLSPEDGSIKSYVLPRDSLRLTNVTTDEAKIGKEEAIVIASEEVKSRKIEDGMTPIIQADGIELRYMLIGNSRLVPYWKVTIRYRSDDLANTDIPEEAKYMGGCLYAVSAVDGEVLFDGSY